MLQFFLLDFYKISTKKLFLVTGKFFPIESAKDYTHQFISAKI